MASERERRIDWDESCAEILGRVEDFFESQESDFDPAVKWAGGWRVGRTSRHCERIRAKASAILPAWVSARAEAHYERKDDE